MRNTVAVGIRRRGRSSYVRSTGRRRKGISLLSHTHSSPKAVEASCAVCGHSPKRRGLPSAELTRKCGDLYVLIAQRHPKHCSTTASANGCDLQKVAINREWSLEQPSGWHKPRLTSPFVFLVRRFHCGGSSEIAHQNCSQIENGNFLLLRSLLIVRLACLDFLHRLVHELNGFFAMSSLVWGGFVQLCSGLLQVSIGCAHVRLMTRHLLALGVTSQRVQTQPEKQDCPAAGRNNFLNHRNSSSGLRTLRRLYFM